MLDRLMPGILGPVDDVLAEEPGVQKAVLDLGTGSAVWAIEVALRYPHVDVVGVVPRGRLPCPTAEVYRRWEVR